MAIACRTVLQRTLPAAFTALPSPNRPCSDASSLPLQTAVRCPENYAPSAVSMPSQAGACTPLQRLEELPQPAPSNRCLSLASVSSQGGACTPSVTLL